MLTMGVMKPSLLFLFLDPLASPLSPCDCIFSCEDVHACKRIVYYLILVTPARTEKLSWSGRVISELCKVVGLLLYSFGVWHERA